MPFITVRWLYWSAFSTIHPHQVCIVSKAVSGICSNREDYLGILLLTGSIASLIIALTWGGNVIHHRAEHTVGRNTPKHIVNAINYNLISQQCRYVGGFPCSIILFI